MASSSSPSRSQPAVAATLLGLPDEVLGQHIVAHPALDPAARLALFRSCHALARMVLLHAPSDSKRVAHHFSGKDGARRWSQRTAALARLLSAKWQPLPPHLHLELCLEPAVAAGAAAPTRPELPSLPPPSSIAQHISRLTLAKLSLTRRDLAAWQLHDPSRWPHLQHLTISRCTLPKGAAAAAAHLLLPPIPRLQSFTWEKQREGQDVAALLPLVANAEQARLALDLFDPGDWFARALRRLPRLTHLRLDGEAADEVVKALLAHPTLAHVTLDSVYVDEDLSQQPCRWRTLSVGGILPLDELSRLPFAALERLTIGGGVDPESSDSEQCAAGLAALQRLHGEGRLALVPDGDRRTTRGWALPHGSGLFDLSGAAEWTPALLRLVVEAGQGVNTLAFDSYDLPLPVLGEEVVPLLGRQGAGIRTLCVDLVDELTEEWCAGLLGALPACIARVHVRVLYTAARFVAALVRGGVQGLGHPLTLTLLHWGEISSEREAELKQLAAGGGGGGTAGQAQPGPLLTLKFTRTR